MIRRIALTTPLALLALTACGDGPSLDGPIDGTAARAHVERLVGFNPRHAGSEGARESAEYLHGQLVELGIEAEIQQWTDPRFKGDDGESMVLRNVIGRIPAAAEAGVAAAERETPILMFGAHYDTKKTQGFDQPERNFEFGGAIDGGGANGALIELAKAVKDRDNQAEIWFVFFDGEESVPWVWDTPQALIGSRWFVQKMDSALRKRIGAFVLLDLIGDEQIKIDRDMASNKELQDIIAAVAKEKEVSHRVYEYSSPVVDDHKSFMDFGIPSVLLIDFQYRAHPMHSNHVENPEGKTYKQWWHSPEDNLENLSADALAFVGNLCWHALDDLEAFAMGSRK